MRFQLPRRPAVPPLVFSMRLTPAFGTWPRHSRVCGFAHVALLGPTCQPKESLKPTALLLLLFSALSPPPPHAARTRITLFPSPSLLAIDTVAAALSLICIPCPRCAQLHVPSSDETGVCCLETGDE
jgi:hypothetical protein